MTQKAVINDKQNEVIDKIKLCVWVELILINRDQIAFLGERNSPLRYITGYKSLREKRELSPLSQSFFFSPNLSQNR